MKIKIVLLITFLSSNALACDCLPPKITDSFIKSDFIAVGNISSVTATSPTETVGNFIPTTVIKGTPPANLQIVGSASPCSRQLEAGEYLIYTSSSHTNVWQCSASHRISNQKKESVEYEINYLRSLAELSAGKKSNFIPRLEYDEFLAIMKPHEIEIARIYKSYSKSISSKNYSSLSIDIEKSGKISQIIFPEDQVNNASLVEEMVEYLNRIHFRKIAVKESFVFSFSKI